MGATARPVSAGEISGRRKTVRTQFLRPPQQIWLRKAGALALFEVAFFFAYRYGMSFSQGAPAPFWFPDSVLLVALLIVPARSWWLYILAAAPIRFLALPADAPPFWFLVLTFVNDSLKAMLAAGLLRRFLPNPVRFDRLRNFEIYVAVAVLGVPMLSAAGGAAAWHALGRPFWPAWQAWFLGDVMANLLLTPAILYWLFGYRDRRRSPQSARLVEGLLLTAGLIALGLVAFSGRLTRPYDFLALLYAPVVFLMWAAIRFGLKGASAALTLSALLAAIAAAEGRSPFATQSAEEHILWIQLFVLAVAFPVLFLAVLVRERDDGAVALRQSEGRYREVVNSQTDLICRYLPDATLTFVNEAYCRFFGRSQEELIGRSLLELIPEEEREATRSRIRALIEERPVDPDDIQVARPDGSFTWLHWVDHVIRGRDGRVAELQSIGRDITDRKNAEGAQRHLAQAARLAQLGELTASIAHEINQPLGAILSNADAAEMLLKSGHLDEIGEILADIRRDDVRAGEVISRVRALVSRRQTDLESVDLRDVTGQVVRLAEAEARRRGVSIALEFEPSLPYVHADRVLLQQVLLNLILNGIDAMADALPDERRLSITAGSAGAFVEVAVADSGHGISDRLLPHIFDSFVTSREDGMGLGLAISRSIVQAHGGRIWAENNPRAGSTLRFTLPIENDFRFASAETK